LAKEQRETVHSIRLLVNKDYLVSFGCYDVFSKGVNTVAKAESSLDDLTWPFLGELPGVKAVMLTDWTLDGQFLGFVRGLDTKGSSIRVVLKR
jgi:hypothetical protein